MLFLALLVLVFQPSPAMLRQVFTEALERRQQEYGETDVRTAQAARDLGLFLARQGDSAGARDALATAVRIDEKVLGPGHAQSLADVAELAAVSDAVDTAALWERAAKSPNPSVASRSFAALGQLRETSGDRERAAQYYRQALAKEETATGKDSAQVAVRLNALARVVEVREGIRLLERALEINRRRLGARHAETATIEANLAGLLLSAKRPKEAAQLSLESIAIFEEAHGKDHPRTAVAVTILAHALRAAGDANGAERNYRRALAIDERALGPKNAQTVDDARALAIFLREIGKQREAAEVERRLVIAP